MYCAQFYVGQVEMLLTLDDRTQPVMLEILTLFHPCVELYLFRSWTIGKSEIVAYKYRSLLHANATKRWHITMTYRERVPQMTAEMFEKCPNEVQE